MSTSLRRFEYADGSSNKFWEVRIDGADVVVRFGKIGTQGQESRRTEKDAAGAAKVRDKLIREKVGKGYRETTKPASNRAPPEKAKGAKGKASAGRADLPTKAKVSGKKVPRVSKKDAGDLGDGEAHPLVTLGQLGSFGDSATVGVLFVDAKHLGGWGAGTTADGGGAEVAVGGGRGVALAVATSQACDVFRFGDALLIGDAYLSEEDGAERGFERALVETKTAKGASKVGTVVVESGVLALHAPVHRAAAAVPRAALAEVAKTGAVALGAKGLILVKVEKGAYELWTESLAKEGPWGELEGRVRLVPSGTVVAPGKPVGKVSAKPKEAPSHAKKAGKAGAASVTTLLLPPSEAWVAVGSMTIAPDGWVFAAESRGEGVCAWAADGSLAWTRRVTRRNGFHPRSVPQLTVTRAGSDVLVYEPDQKGSQSCLHVFDAHTGKEKGVLDLPKAGAVLAAPDGKALLVRGELSIEPRLRLHAYPKAKHGWTAADDSLGGWTDLAVSRDGRWAAMAGDQLQVLDLRSRSRLPWTRALPTVAPWPYYDTPVAVGFSPDGKRVVVGSKVWLRIYDTETGAELAKTDPSPGKRSKPAVCGVAASADHVAVAREDGTVLVFDAKLRNVVREIAGLRNNVPNKSTQEEAEIASVAFDAAGGLWISATGKKAAVGVSRQAF